MNTQLAAQWTVQTFTLSHWNTESINLSLGAVYFLLSLHYIYTTLCFVQLWWAQRSSPRRLTCSLWYVYSDALPECFAFCRAVRTLWVRPHFIRSVFAVWFPLSGPGLYPCGYRGLKRRQNKVRRRGGECYESPVTRLNLAISPATLMIDDGPRTNKASVLSIGAHNGKNRAVHCRLQSSEGKEMSEKQSCREKN